MPRKLTPDDKSMITQADTVASRKERFLVFLEKHFSLAPAARAAGYSRECIYDWLRSDPAFKAAFKERREAAIDNLEGSFYQSALKGHTVKGIVILKGNRENYQERREQAAPVQQVQVVFDNVTPPTYAPMPTSTPMATPHAIDTAVDRYTQLAMPWDINPSPDDTLDAADTPLLLGDGQPDTTPSRAEALGLEPWEGE